MLVDELLKEVNEIVSFYGKADAIVGIPNSLMYAVDGDFLFVTEKYFDDLLQMVAQQGLKNCVILISNTYGFYEKENTYLFVEDIKDKARGEDHIRLVYAKCVAAMTPVTKFEWPEFLGYRKDVFSVGSIEKDCKVGSNVYVGQNVLIKNGTVIGNNVTIFPGAVIGVDGFGFHRDKDGTLIRFPHLSNVIIEDNVEIGANTVINRGSLSPTIIGKGSKIDSFNHIAHNVVLGKNVWIASGSVLAGGVKVGDNSNIATGVITRDNVKIGKNVFCGVGSLIVKDVPDDTIVMGSPAREINEYKRYLNFVSNGSMRRSYP